MMRVQGGWTARPGGIGRPRIRTTELGLGLLVLVCVFIGIILPRTSQALRTSALQRTISELPVSARVVMATTTVAGFGGPMAASQLSVAQTKLARYLLGVGLPLRPSAAWSSLQTPFMLVSHAAPSAYIHAIPPRLQLIFRADLQRYARLLAGRWPTAVAGGATYDVAVTAATAAQYSLRIGSRVQLSNGPALTVTGIVLPLMPGSAFWTEFASTDAPQTIAIPGPGGPIGAYWQASAFIAPAELQQLSSSYQAFGQIAWVFPLDTSRVSAASAAGLLRALNEAVSQGDTVLQPAVLTFSSDLISPVTAFISADSALVPVLSLMFVSLAALGAAVILLCVRLVAAQRESEQAVMRARGAARWQLSWLALRDGGAAILPAAAAAAAAAVAITPADSQSLSWWLAGATVLIALSGPAWLAARPDPASRPFRKVSRTAARRMAAARRWVAEGALICVAVISVIVLRQQGLSSTGAVNVLTSAAPILVAIPAALVAIRIGPVLLRWILRLSRRGRGVVAFVGLVRGNESLATSSLGVFGLVLALSLVSFGGMVRAAITNGQIVQSWRQTGADVVIGSPSSGVYLTAPAIRAIAAVPGVDRIAPVLEDFVWLTNSGTTTPVNLLGLNPVQYAAVIDRIPGQSFPAAKLAQPVNSASPVPVLASRAATAIIGGSIRHVTVGSRTFPIRVSGIVAGSPAAPGYGPFFIVPDWALDSKHPLPPTMALIDGPHVDRARLTAALNRTAPGALITFRSDVLASLQGAPLPAADFSSFNQDTVAAACLSLLLLALFLLVGARSREITMTRLSTMGLSRRQMRQLSIVEAVPPVLAAVVAGMACTVTLAPLLGPALDLSAFAGSGAVPVRPDVRSLALSDVVLILLAIVILVGQALAANRSGIARTLRISD